MEVEQVQFDVAVLTVIGPELEAVQRALGVQDDRDRIREKGDLFWTAKVKSKFRKRHLRVLVHCLGEPGEPAAAAAASKVIERFHPSFMLLCGIAAGRRDKTKIGDVAVSIKGIVDHGTSVAIDGRTEPRIWAPAPPHAVKQMFHAFRWDEAAHSHLVLAVFPNGLVPPAGQEADYQKHVTTTPALHDCAVASADILLRDAEILERLSRTVHQGIRIGEMEAAGFVKGCENRHPMVPWLVVRGVSDFGDSFKNDAFHRLASCTAASFVTLFLKTGFDVQLLQLSDPKAAKPQQNAVLINAAPSAVGGEALAKLRRLSDIGWNDAGLIEEGRPQEGTEIHLDELYVPRTVEKEILDVLLRPTQNDGPRTVFVVGDAGQGKTSLLWHLAKPLGEDKTRTVFFLKATNLLLTTEVAAPSGLTVNEIETAIALAARENKDRGVVLLLDTVDLQVRDATRRDALLAFLEILTDLGCQVVASCRPQEFAILKPRKVLKVELQDYDASELSEAVRKHARWAYWDKDNLDWESQVALIQDAVTAGRPIREVCMRPLTLRMLFSLYRPNRISLEIHQFALYRAFWDLRVKQDLRAGMQTPREAAENLERSAAVIALTMLGEGEPEVGASAIERVLSSHGIEARTIDSLVTRGILRRTQTNTVCFFHQTFFEHAGARGLLSLAPGSLREEVRSHIAKNPNDLFLAPVYEQLLLLLLSDGLSHERILAQEHLVELIRSPELNHQLSGLYVFAHAPEDLPVASGPLKVFLRTGGVEAVKRYIQLLPNRAFRADRSALDEVEIIWGRADWNLMIGAFELLERLAGRDPAAVSQFLKGEERITKALRTQRKRDAHIVYWPLLRVMDRVAAEDPKWFWEVLQQVHSEITSEPSKADIIPYIVRVACRHAEIIGLDAFETYFKVGLPMRGNTEEWKRLPANTTAGYGQVWARVWELRRTSIDDVVREIAASNGFDLKMAVAGLANHVLTSGNLEQAAVVWAAFERDAEVSRRWLWVRVFWHTILEQWSQGQQACAQSLIEMLGHRLAALTKRLPDATAQEFVDQIMETIGDAICSRQVLLLLFADPAFKLEETWGACRSLLKKLPQAARADILGAQKFLDRIVAGECPDWTEGPGPLIHGLGESMADEPKMKWILLSLGIRWRDIGAIVHALKAIQLAGEEANVTPEMRNRLVGLCHPPLPSRTSPEEMLQLQLRNLVTFLGWDPLEPLTVLLEDCERTRHPPRFSLLLRRLEHGCVCGHYQASQILKESERLAAGLPQKLQGLWFSSLTVCLVRSSEASKAALSHAYALMIKQGADFHQLALFGPLLEKWVSVDVAAAVALTCDFLTSAPVRALGRSATYRLSHKLQVALAKLIDAASRAQREALLDLVPRVHGVLGASLIHVMGSRCPEDLNPRLEGILHDASVDEFVRSMILNQRKIREALLQTQGYRWLSQALSGQIAGPSPASVDLI